MQTTDCGHLEPFSTVWAHVIRETIAEMSKFWRAHLNQVFGCSWCWHVDLELPGSVWADVLRGTIEETTQFSSQLTSCKQLNVDLEPFSTVWANAIRETIEEMTKFWRVHLNQVFGCSGCWHVDLELPGSVWAEIPFDVLCHIPNHVYLSMYTCPYTYLSIHLSIYSYLASWWCMYLSFKFPLCLFMHPSMYLFMYISIDLSI